MMKFLFLICFVQMVFAAPMLSDKDVQKLKDENAKEKEHQWITEQLQDKIGKLVFKQAEEIKAGRVNSSDFKPAVASDLSPVDAPVPQVITWPEAVKAPVQSEKSPENVNVTAGTELKETEPKKTEPKEVESKKAEDKEAEAKETEPKEVESKKTEPKEEKKSTK